MNSPGQSDSTLSLIGGAPPAARRITAGVMALAAAVGLLYYGKLLFVAFFFSLFLSFAINPLVALLERARVPRVLAILLILFVASALVVLVASNMYIQLAELFERLPEYTLKLRSQLEGLEQWLTEIRQRTTRILPVDAQEHRVREVKLAESPLSLYRGLFAGIGTTLGAILFALTIPFISFFMLKDKERFLTILTRMVASRRRLEGGTIVESVSRTLQGFVIGELFVIIIVSLLITSGLLLLKVNYYYVLGPLAGCAVLIPYLGVVIGTAPALLVTFFQYDLLHVIYVLILYSSVQFLEGNIITPLVVGSKVNLNPLAVMMAFLFWGMLWGVFGAILAVPLTAMIKVICQHVGGWQHYAALLGDEPQ